MTEAYFSIRGGMLEAKRYGSKKIPEAIEALNTPALVEWIKENKIESVMYSSSCDFPEDGGLPEDIDIRGWIDAAFEQIADETKAIAREDLRNKIGTVLDKHFQAHPEVTESAVDELMELTVLS